MSGCVYFDHSFFSQVNNVALEMAVSVTWLINPPSIAMEFFTPNHGLPEDEFD